MYVLEQQQTFQTSEVFGFAEKFYLDKKNEPNMASFASRIESFKNTRTPTGPTYWEIAAVAMPSQFLIEKHLCLRE